MDLLDVSKPFQHIYLRGSQTGGYIKVDDDDLPDENSFLETAPKGTDYVKEYLEREYSEQKKGRFVEKECEAGEPSVCDLELTSAGTYCNVNEIQEERLTQVYEEYYNNKIKIETGLVIRDYKARILTMIELNEVTIITGPTGCGKTTQVPQFILDSHAEKNAYCNIIVTQPRRLAAISIPKRVCEERDWPLGTICGYKVGLKDCTSEDTRLTFVTVGVFLQMLIHTKHLNNFTHVILDEIHERDEVMDFVLLTTKKLHHSCSRNVKVILMSATADVQKIAAYFEKRIVKDFQSAPIIHIRSSTNFLVQIYYLEELSALGQLPDLNYDQPGLSNASIMICIKLIKQFEKLDQNKEDKKSVLVFLPGIYEIEELYNKLTNPKIYKAGDMEYKWLPIALHSTVTVEEQARIFHTSPSGQRKIILATNVAESSITVPDVMFVIDFCLTKVLVTDRNTNFTSLQLCWASKANCIQRAGRAGRVMEGRVYRMVYKRFYEAFEEQCTPSLLRCPLEKVVLQAKLLNMGSPKSILALALDPPDLSNIEKTVVSLKEVGGLLLTPKGENSNSDGEITYLGRLMALLPVDINITRLMVLGHVFSCLEECIVMGACMSLKSIFSSPFLERMKSYNSKLEWADGSCSDCIAFLNVYEVWKINQANGYYKRSAGGGEAGWAKRHFIQIRALKEVHLLVQELTRRLQKYNIENSVGIGKVQWSEVQKSFILKFIIAGAFYPNYFFRGARGGQVSEQEAVRVLGGRNPFRTVYLSGYQKDQPPELYSHLIKDLLSECKAGMKIEYDSSSKVFIEFNNERMISHSEIPFCSKVPGKINTAVYRAVKLRQASQKLLNIKVLPPHEAKKMAVKLGLGKRPNNFSYQVASSFKDEISKKELFQTILPGVEVNLMQVKVTHILDPSNFWVASTDSQSESNEKQIFAILNGPKRNLSLKTQLPELGEILVAPYEDVDGVWLYRARVVGLKKINELTFAEVYFIDYGNTELVPVEELQELEGNQYQQLGQIPALAFQCTLTKIKPSPITNPNGKWSENAKEEFEKHTEQKHLFLSVYSVVGDVASVYLFGTESDETSLRQFSINDILIKRGFAEEAEESYLSKENNQLRMEKQLDSEQTSAYNNLQIQENWSQASTFEPPDLRDSKTLMNLKGPFSPLEMKVFSCTRNGTSKQIIISPTSVNSVLLDSDPEDPHERMIVAARVSQNQSKSSLILHHTTILPNIHGLAALISFIFAPTVELRVDEKRTMFTGLLCGLGLDEKNQPLFPEHDMEIIFDCEFDWEDFCNVNKLRFFMSLLLLDEKDRLEPVHTQPDVISLQNKIQKCLLQLIDKTRPSIELHFPKKEFKWGLVPSNLKVVENSANSYSKSAVFPFHPGVEITLDPNLQETLLFSLDNVVEVSKKRQEELKNLECAMCQLSLNDNQSIETDLAIEENEEEVFELNDSPPVP